MKTILVLLMLILCGNAYSAVVVDSVVKNEYEMYTDSVNIINIVVNNALTKSLTTYVKLDRTVLLNNDDSNSFPVWVGYEVGCSSWSTTQGQIMHKLPVGIWYNEMFRGISYFRIDGNTTSTSTIKAIIYKQAQ